MEKADKEKFDSGEYELRQPDKDSLDYSRMLKDYWDRTFGFRPKSIWNVPTKANFGHDKELEKLLFSDTVAKGSYVTGNIREGYMLIPRKKSLSQFPLALAQRLIMLYSKIGDTVFDPFSGMGERMQVASWLNRNYIGYDISKRFHDQKNEIIELTPDLKGKREIVLQDSRNCLLESESIDYIYTSPPYHNVEVKAYGDEPEQLGYVRKYDDFLVEYEKVIKNCFKVLKPGHLCTFVVGNFRRNKKLIPFTEDTVRLFLNAGFDYHDNIVYEMGTFAAMFIRPVLKFRRMGKTHENILTFRKPGEWRRW